jgi:fatty acid desaturase
MLRYKEDIRTLGFVAAYFSVTATAWLWHPDSWALRAVLIGVCCLFAFFCAVITHNTIHVPVFHNRVLNKLFQYTISLCYGHPVSAFVPGHNLSHHTHTQTRKDVMRSTKVQFRWNFLNQLLFAAVLSKDILRADYSYAMAMRTERPRWYRQWVSEWIFFVLIQAALLILNPLNYLLYIFIPHNYAGWGIIGINFIQHDGTDQSHPYNHGRNFVGRITNWWTFNNGYHSLHHDKPSLHWSRLPEEHARLIAPHIHPNLDQKSLLAYVWKMYGWPGKRIDYLGNPLVLPEEGPDDLWIPGIADHPAHASTGAEA